MLGVDKLSEARVMKHNCRRRRWELERVARKFDVGSQQNVQAAIILGPYTSDIEISRGVLVVRRREFQFKQLPPALKYLLVSIHGQIFFLENRVSRS